MVEEAETSAHIEPVEEKIRRPGRSKRAQATLDPKGIASREVAHAIKVAVFLGGRT